jgi:hypothetical protein
MHVICTNNQGFEDSRTVGKIYTIVESKGDSYMIKTDNGSYQWVGRISFKVVPNREK